MYSLQMSGQTASGFGNFTLLHIGNADGDDDGDKGDDGSNPDVFASVSLSCCGLLPGDLDKVWESLGTSSDLTLLE